MALSGYESPMLPKHVFGTGDIANHPNANKPVGTGPFKFVEWQKGQYMRDRNAEYWRQGTPYLDRIVARFIADGATPAAAMETQEVHIGGFSAILPLDVKRLQALPHIAVTTRGYEMQSPIIELDFNTQKKAVRQCQGTSGRRVCDRPQVRHRQHLVWIRSAGHRAHQLELQGNRALDRRRAQLQRAQRARDGQQAAR